MPSRIDRESLQGPFGSGPNGESLPQEGHRSPSGSAHRSPPVPPTPVEAQLRAFIGDLLDGCAVGVIILDPHLRVLWVNQALEQMLSLRREEVLGQDYRRLVHERIKYAFADPEGFASQALGPARGGELASLECHVPSATGRQECWLEYSSRQIQGGFFAGGRIEHFYDVTRRQAALDSLRRSQRLLERMFASMPDPVFVVDAAMVVVECNPAASHVFGYPPEELVGHDTTILYADPEGRQQFLASLETSLREKGYLFMSQLPMRRKNGEVFPVDLTVVPLEQEAGERSGYVAVVRDVSERVALDEMKTAFVASVSHELRSPLSSILGYVEILLDSDPGELTPSQREFLEIIRQSGERLRWLVDDILDVSRIEAGEFTLEISEVEPAALVERTLETLLPRAQEAGLQLSASLGEGLPRIKADPRRLQQVLENLINNAINFTPAGGQIRVSIATKSPNCLVLEVADTGVGIAPEDIPEIFERFRRGRNLGETGPSGTGLGLYIVRAIVEAHGGWVEVESEVGKGSAFRVYLPREGPGDVK